MKKWLKENWFKAICAFLFTIVAIAVAYYFFLFLPEQKQESMALKNKQECQEAAEELREKEEEQIDNLLNYEIRFIPEEQLCLYKSGHILSEEKLIMSHRIIDVYTNETLASYSEQNGEVFFGSEIEFNQVEEEYFQR